MPYFQIKMYSSEHTYPKTKTSDHMLYTFKSIQLSCGKLCYFTELLERTTPTFNTKQGGRIHSWEVTFPKLRFRHGAEQLLRISNRLRWKQQKEGNGTGWEQDVDKVLEKTPWNPPCILADIRALFFPILSEMPEFRWSALCPFLLCLFLYNSVFLSWSNFSFPKLCLVTPSCWLLAWRQSNMVHAA